MKYAVPAPEAEMAEMNLALRKFWEEGLSEVANGEYVRTDWPVWRARPCGICGEPVALRAYDLTTRPRFQRDVLRKGTCWPWLCRTHLEARIAEILDFERRRAERVREILVAHFRAAVEAGL